MTAIPIIDVSPFLTAAEANRPTAAQQQTAAQIDAACRNEGFFYITGHGIPEELQQRLEERARHFFSLPLEQKMEIRMERGGRAWRGYFPLGQELTSGRPDQKEGLYFGDELPDTHPRVRSRTPLHGRNLFPNIPGFRETVLEWLARMTELGHVLMRAMSVSLGLPPSRLREHCTNNPLVLFRIFHYPPLTADADVRNEWSVGEHTDYGLLTILKQDHTGGLQIRTRSGWIDAPVIDNTFVCNLGDMLERMTGGLWTSTPHRVRNVSGRSRLSFPFFFDPDWDVQVRPIRLSPGRQPDDTDRWDGASVHDWTGTYGDYILQKVARVFPELQRRTSKPT